MESLIKCSLDILENPKNSIIVDRMRGIHELTNHTNSMWNIRMSNSEIDQTTNQLTIVSSIRYWFTIQGFELCIVFQGSGNSLFVGDIGFGEKIKSIFSLGKIVAIRRWGNLKPKKIAESAQIFHLKMLTKEVVKRTDTCRIISSNNHIINIKKDKSDTNRGSLDKESSVMRTRSETLLSNNWAKPFKPSSRSLLKAIKSTAKATNLTAWVWIAKGWLHVHFFLEVSIEESILHFHLIKRPMMNSSHSNETSNRCKASNRSKCFLIVNAILLSKALGN